MSCRHTLAVAAFLGLLCIAAMPAFAADHVAIARQGDTLVVQVDGAPFTTFYFGAEAPKPYFHPLREASGRIITRGYPMIRDNADEIRLKYQDHPHHRGLWYSHGNVNGVDFWAEGRGKGHIVFRSLDQLKSGDTGQFTATFDWVTPASKKVLTETKTVVISGDAKTRILDITEVLHANDEAVKFGDTKEGTFAVRLAPLLAPDHGGTMVSATGGKGEKEIWGKRANWVDYYTTTDGETYGISIFDDPRNPKHPTYWHARAYGLFAANPFGEHDFYADKSRDGSLTVQPDGRITFRYRVLIHAGDTTAAGVAAQYEKYAAAAK